jgi:hypothetical protein
MKRFLTRRFLLVYLVAIVALGAMTYVAPKVFATGSFTVSNVKFDPTTGILTYDETGTYDNGIVSILQNGGNGTNLWAGSTATCVSGSCTVKMNPTVSDSLDSGVTSVTLHDNSGDVSQVLNYPLPYGTTNSPLFAYASVANGWVRDGNTWTYASADSPTFTATASGDLTGVYTPGQRIKLTQSSTTKYFLVTGVSYSSPNTTITLYGGIDYTLTNSTISNIYFSAQKAPVGFPLDPAKWTVESIYASDSNQASPTVNTWYNIGSRSLNVPIGAWRLVYSATFSYDDSTVGFYNAYVTLSTSNNSESDINMTDGVSLANSTIATGKGYKEKFINLTTKTTYYLNIRSTASGLNFLGSGGAATPTVIRAICTYL